MHPLQLQALIWCKATSPHLHRFVGRKGLCLRALSWQGRLHGNHAKRVSPSGRVSRPAESDTHEVAAKLPSPPTLEPPRQTIEAAED